MIGTFPICLFILYHHRYGQNGRCDCIGHVMKNISTRSKNQRALVLRSASASDSPHCSNVTRDLSSPELYQQVPMLISYNPSTYFNNITSSNREPNFCKPLLPYVILFLNKRPDLHGLFLTHGAIKIARFLRMLGRSLFRRFLSIPVIEMSLLQRYICLFLHCIALNFSVFKLSQHEPCNLEEDFLTFPKNFTFGCYCLFLLKWNYVF